MNKLKVKFKKLRPESIIPCYAKAGDAGLDLTATSLIMDEKGNAVYGTGLAVEIPEGYVGLLFPRSSIAKKNQVLTNSVGVIDSGYRGEIMLKFKPTEVYLNHYESSTFDFKKMKDNGAEVLGETMYNVGEKIGQLIIIPFPAIETEECAELSETERGSGGFGSSDKK